MTGIPPWDAQTAGRDLLAEVSAVIAGVRERASLKGRIASNSEIARAVLASPAIAESCRRNMDALEAEYQPRIAAKLIAEAAQITEAVTPAIRAAVAGEIASAIEVDICTPEAECGDMECRQAQADAATARRIGDAA